MSEQIEPVHLPRALRDALVAHARAGKPEEVCGVLRGRGAQAFELVRGRNVASDKVNNYDVDPQTLLLQFDFEEAGDEMMGIYHSHPVSPAYPSATDAWSAHYPDAYYLICSLQFDDAPSLRAFRFTPHFFDKIDQLPGSVSISEIDGALAGGEIRPGSGVRAHFQRAEHASTVEPIARLAEAVGVDAPYHLLLQRSKQGAAQEVRLVAIREHPIQIE